jgi:hypothetical protein
MIYLGLFLGVVIYVLLDFNQFEGNLANYINEKDNVITTVLNAVVGVALILSWKMEPTSLEFLGISKITFLTAMIFGITGHTLIQSIVKSMSKKTKTKLGVK